jgi:Xaa-Pro aminopeptidase
MFESLETLPVAESAERIASCLRHLEEVAPEAGGLFVFSRLNIYYFTGVMASGVLWLPRGGEPVLMMRRGLERARLESPLEHILPFRSYKDLPSVAAEAGSPLPEMVACEMGGLPWHLGQMLAARLPESKLVQGDFAIARTRSVKSQWELAKLRLAGARHHKALHEMLPERLAPGMNERDISLKCWDVFYELGHHGVMRMNTFGEEIFLGHVAAGDSGNYPSIFDGPLGLRGQHPAAAQMGYAGQVWREGDVLACDVGFSLEGYATDKTQVYFAGRKSDIPRQARAAQDFCIEVQAWLADHLRPGEIPSRLWAHVSEWATEAGFGEGFMALAPNTVRFAGHGIGLAIDEYPVIAKGFDAPFEAGMVMALEPKIGIEGYGMVGVENTFEVTEAGGACLTGDEYDIVCVG